MKIVNRTEFLRLPANTVFSNFHPIIVGDTSIKGDTLGEDFLVQEINGSIDAGNAGEYLDKLLDSQRNGTEVAMDFDRMGRDGMYDEDQLFAVWSCEDLAKLIARLTECLPAYGKNGVKDNGPKET